MKSSVIFGQTEVYFQFDGLLLTGDQ